MSFYTGSNNEFGSASRPSSSHQISYSDQLNALGLPDDQSPVSPRSFADEDNIANGRQHSLAHELAVALMPEPSTGTKILAEEFGIEYDEGAEGIDDTSHNHTLSAHQAPEDLALVEQIPHDHASYTFGTATSSNISQRTQRTGHDALDAVAWSLPSTDKFLSQLRRLDTDAYPSTKQITLEALASDIIRRINETARDREGQVRELLEYEREFRKIAGELGGNDVLGQLEALTEVDTLLDDDSVSPFQKEANFLESVPEEPVRSYDWEADTDQHD